MLLPSRQAVKISSGYVAKWLKFSATKYNRAPINPPMKDVKAHAMNKSMLKPLALAIRQAKHIEATQPAIVRAVYQEISISPQCQSNGPGELKVNTASPIYM